MTLANNATIKFNGVIPKEAVEKLTELIDEDTMRFALDSSGKASNLVIEEAWGDISDDLNEIVEILRPYGIKPLVGECNRYYGDYDGYDVFTGEAFESMDDEEYGAWLNKQTHAETVAVAKKIVEYAKSHKEEANSVYGVKCTENREFIPAELRALIEELGKALQK